MKLKATLALATSKTRSLAVLVHGITTDRNEDGFYTEMARLLSNAGTSSLRFDLRGHGQSEGTYETLTLTGVMNDICAAVREIRNQLKAEINLPLMLIAASFGGGLAAYWCSENQEEVSKLVLLNPLLDYAKRMLYSKPIWDGKGLTTDGVRMLNEKGWLPHFEFRMGRALINELIYIRPYEKMSSIKIPVLTIHGDHDSSVPFETAKKYALPNDKCEFFAVEGAEHGFMSLSDEIGDSPQTLRFQNLVFGKVVQWIG